MNDRNTDAESQSERPITWDDLPPLMDELRVMARRLIRRDAQTEILETSSLVRTALKRQKRQDTDFSQLTWENRRHFLGSVHRAMKHTLIDRGQRGQTKKRDGFQHAVPLDELLSKNVRDLTLQDLSEEQIAALLSALDRLKDIEPEWAEAVEHYFFGDLTWREIAQMLEVDARTVYNWRQPAYDLLRDEIQRILDGAA